MSNELKYEPTRVNPQLRVAQDIRLIEIDETDIFIGLYIRWKHETNEWNVYYSVMRKSGGATYDEGCYEILTDAVNAACDMAGIKANDPDYQMKLKGTEKLKKVLDVLAEVENLLGDSNSVRLAKSAASHLISKIAVDNSSHTVKPDYYAIPF